MEQWDENFSVLDDYGGVNSNMHTVEALLSAADVRSDRILVDRALTIVTHVVHGFARSNKWRLPEHFDRDWNFLPDYNADSPAHPFRPFDATIGHWLEWARLALHVRAALGADKAPSWLVDDARSLFDAAVREGWSVDGEDGFVYTVDWQGRPVVRERMHWVAAEATATAAALWSVTAESLYEDWYQRWWDYIATAFIDRDSGSWWHELDPQNRPSSVIWSGKPDSYHALQATLILGYLSAPCWQPLCGKTCWHRPTEVLPQDSEGRTSTEGLSPAASRVTGRNAAGHVSASSPAVSAGAGIW